MSLSCALKTLPAGCSALGLSIRGSKDKWSRPFCLMAHLLESAPKLNEGDGKGGLNQVTCTDLSLYEHEDETVSSSFQDSDLDELEAYAMIFGDDEVYDDGDWIDDGAILKQLTFPF